ncbi:hypothetical protein SK128_015334 [Halocaridina rubra]|uniref:Uncharacterized protein n=1 Tax=Halocaridina rubra TaxID=373956 RepID=A0AAN8X8P0_HALRR
MKLYRKGHVVYLQKCALFFVQVLALVSISAGVAKWLLGGYSVAVSALLICGGIVTIVVVIGYLWNRNNSETSLSTTTIYHSEVYDPPPKYRLTWRKEFLKAIPEHLRTDLEKGSKGQVKDKREKNAKTVPSSGVVIGVQGVTSSHLDIHTINTSHFRYQPNSELDRASQLIASGSSRENFVYEMDVDKELPTYDEATSF